MVVPERGEGPLQLRPAQVTDHLPVVEVSEQKVLIGGVHLNESPHVAVLLGGNLSSRPGLPEDPRDDLLLLGFPSRREELRHGTQLLPLAAGDSPPAVLAPMSLSPVEEPLGGVEGEDRRGQEEDHQRQQREHVKGGRQL